jgi:uncharacterized protein YciI
VILHAMSELLHLLIAFREAADAEAFAAADPYKAAGLIVSSRIEPWAVVT